VLRSGSSIAFPCALCLSACALLRSPPAPPAASTAPAYDRREATLSNGLLTIEVKIPHAPAGPKPAVIALIGKQEALLEAGMVVATYRLNGRTHGVGTPPPPAPTPRTYGEWMLASPTRGTVGAGFFGVIWENASRVTEVVDYLTRLPEVDPERIGIMGVSTTGFTALEATATDVRIRVAVVVAACGDYPTFLHLSSLGMNGEPSDLDPAYARELQSHEALIHPERLTHAALLMVNGTGDRTVPIECAQTTATALRVAYAKAGAPERFRLLVREGAAHSELAGPSGDEILAWLKRWLEPAEPQENR